MTVREYNQSVEDYSDNIFRFLLGNLKNKEFAEDIVQETYEKLWMKRGTVSYEKVRAYLFTAAYHTMIDWIRKEKRIVSMEGLSVNPQAEEKVPPDLNELLHKAIGRLPADQRAVIILRDYEGYSYKEIAEITGQTEPQVKINIYRGRKFLKNYIGSIEVLL